METNSIKSNAINFGLYLGGALSLFTILGYGISLEILISYWVTLLIMPLAIIGTGVFAILNSKKSLGGFINFKQAFSAYFITVAVAMIISTIVSVVIFNFVDPDAAVEIKRIVVEKTITTMENMGAPSEAIAETIIPLEEQDMFGVMTQFRSLAGSLMFFAIIGLIAAAIMKKKNENA